MKLESDSDVHSQLKSLKDFEKREELLEHLLGVVRWSVGVATVGFVRIIGDQ